MVETTRFVVCVSTKYQSTQQSAMFAGSAKMAGIIQNSSALGILRDQEETQLYVGQAPGKFDVHTPPGQEFQIAAPGAAGGGDTGGGAAVSSVH